jgi:senataxin
LIFPFIQPFSIFDVDSAEERGGTSLANSTEANFALHLYRSLAKEAGHIATQSRVCIITPYSQQAALLRRTFSQGLGHEYTSRVEVNTVDSFQGREANIIIFSCVRAAGSRGIGFLSDVRRMNVALTRAKHFLFVIARCQSIVVNPYWDQLVKHAREGRAIIPVPMQGRFQFPELSSLEAMKPIPKEMIPVSKKRKASSSIQEGNDSDDEDGEICI